jgi:HEAT repeat protein
MNVFGGLRTNRCMLAAIAASFLAPTAAAQIPQLSGDGWHTWSIEPVESVPEMCCYSWKRGRTAGQGCDLDSGRGGFSTSTDRVGGDVQLFVRLEGGAVADIRALSASCPVTTSSPVNDLGQLSNAQSVAWLSNVVESGDEFASEAVMAISVHRGGKARDWLADKARTAGDQDIREEAIFWMAQVRVEDTNRELKRFIYDDGDPDIRKHAAFSYSQSDADDIADVLIRQGERDEDPDVRSQAWFWLAQSEAAESERAIGKAVREDEDADVREEAVFALSQLPGDRSVKALADILENSDLDLEVREQALFWLAQSESDEAFEYIDSILTDN